MTLKVQGADGLEDEIRIGDETVPVWPADQVVRAKDEQRQVLHTRFKDHELYHPSLSEVIAARVGDPTVAAQHHRALGGIKLYGLEDSVHPAVRLLNARALALFKIATGATQGVIDTGWANVFQNGDYITAHSHIRAKGSVVYCLDDGRRVDEVDTDNRFAGQLCIIDPRYPPCCKLKAGCMTNPVILKMRPGAMTAFPAALVHAVHPYEGRRPRITFAWNITEAKLPGDTLSFLKLEDAARFDAG